MFNGRFKKSPKAIVALLVAFADGDRCAATVLTHWLTARVMGQEFRMLDNIAEAKDVT